MVSVVGLGPRETERVRVGWFPDRNHFLCPEREDYTHLSSMCFTFQVARYFKSWSFPFKKQN